MPRALIFASDTRRFAHTGRARLAMHFAGTAKKRLARGTPQKVTLVVTYIFDGKVLAASITHIEVGGKA